MHLLLAILFWTGIGISGLAAFGFIVSVIRSFFDKTPARWAGTDVSIAESRASKEAYWRQILVAFDIFCNVVFFFGKQDETISTHAYRASLEHKIWGEILNGWLDWLQPNHGQMAASGDLYRASSALWRLNQLLGVKS